VEEVRVTIAGKVIVASREDVEAVARGLKPEPVTKHWVKVAGKMFPPKQLLEAVAKAKGVPLNRLDFQTMSARRFFNKLGFEMNQ